MSDYAAFVLDVETPGTPKLREFTRAILAAAREVNNADFSIGKNKKSRDTFAKGLETDLANIANEAQRTINKLEGVSKALKAGAKVPKGTVPDLPSGLNTAQALKRTRDQAAQRASQVIGERAAKAGIDSRSPQLRNIAANLVRNLEDNLTDASRKILGNLRSSSAATTAQKNATFGTNVSLKLPEADEKRFAASLARVDAAYDRLAEAVNAEAKRREAAGGGKGGRGGRGKGGGGGGSRGNPIIVGDDDGGDNTGTGGVFAEDAAQQRVNAANLRELRKTKPGQVVRIKGTKITADLSRSIDGIIRFFEDTTEGARSVLASEAKHRNAYQRLLDVTNVDPATGVITPNARNSQSQQSARQRQTAEEVRAAKEDADRAQAAREKQNEQRLRGTGAEALRLNNQNTLVEQVPGFNPDFNIRTKAGFRQVERDTREYLDLLEVYQRRLGGLIAARIAKTTTRGLPADLRPDELAQRAGVQKNLAAQRQAAAEQQKRQDAAQAAQDKANAARLRADRGSNPFGVGIGRAFGRSNAVLTEDSGQGGFNPDFNVRSKAGYRAVARSSDEHLELLKRYQEQEGAGIAARIDAETKQAQRQEAADRKRGQLEASAERQDRQRTQRQQTAAQRAGKLQASAEKEEAERLNAQRLRGARTTNLGRNIKVEGEGFNPDFNVRSGRDRFRSVQRNTPEYADLERQFQDKQGADITARLDAEKKRADRQAAADRKRGQLEASAERQDRERTERQRVAAQRAAVAQQRRDQTSGRAQTSAEGINKERDTEARLRAGASGGRSFKDDVSRVYGRSNRALAEEVPGFNPDFYRKTKDGYEKVERASGAYLDLLGDYQQRLAAQLSKEIGQSRLGNDALRPNELAERAAEQKRRRAQQAAQVEQDKRQAVEQQRTNFAAYAGKTQQLNPGSGKVQFLNSTGRLTFGQSGPQNADPDFLVREGKDRLRLVERDSTEYLDLLDKLQKKLAAEISKALGRDEFTRLTGGGRASRLRAGVFSETTPGREFNPDFFDVNEKKQTAAQIANPTRETQLLRQYQEKVAKEIADAIEGTTDKANFERLRQGRRTGQSFNDDVRRSGRALLEDDANNPYQPRAFRANIKAGTATEIPKDTAEYIDLVRKYQEQVGAELTQSIEELKAGGRRRPTRQRPTSDQRQFDAEANQERKAEQENAQRDNAKRLRAGAVGAGQGREFADGVVRVGEGVIADTREAILRLYKSTENGYEELKSGTEPYINAQRSLVDHSTARQSSTVSGSFFRGLTSGGVFGSDGHQGGALQGLATAAGTTTKYALLGSTLYGIKAAAAAAISELLDFEDSVTELNVAMGETQQSAGFITDLSEAAARAGSNVGEAMDVAASGIRAFKDETDGTRSSMERLGVSFATQASRISTLTKTDLTTAADSLKAAALGFDLDPTSFSRITDVLAGAKQIGGGDEADTVQGLAQIASAFKEIGFTAEESGSIISKVVAATGQSGQAVATKLSRITSIVGGSAGQKAIRALNQTLDPDKQVQLGGSVSDQIKQLGAVYNQLSEAQKKPLINALGGTSSPRELEILLANITAIEKKANDPANFNGKGAEEYQERLKDLRATLTQITGEVKNIAAALLTSGIADPIFALVKFGLLPALRTSRQILGLWNQFPGPLKTALGVAVALFAAQKAIAAVRNAPNATGVPGGGGGLKNYFLGIEGRVSPGRQIARDQQRARDLSILNSRSPDGKSRSREGQEFLDALHGQAITEDKFRNVRRSFRGDEVVKSVERAAEAFGTKVIGAGGAFARNLNSPVTFKGIASFFTKDRGGPSILGAVGGGTKGLLKGGGALLASELGPIGLIIGAASIAQGTIAATRRISNAVRDFNSISLIPEQDVQASAESLKSSAANLRSSANTLDESADGFFGKIVNFISGADIKGKANSLRKVAAADEFAGNAIQSKKNQIAARGQSDDLSQLIDFSGNDAFTQSLDTVKSTGADAAHQMEALQKALGHLIETSKGGVASFGELDKYSLRQSVAAGAEGFVQQQIKQNKQDVKTTSQIANGNVRDKDGNVVRDTGQAAASRKDQKDLENVDPTAVNIASQGVINAALADGKDPAKNADDKKEIYTSLVAALEPVYKNPKLAREAADNITRQFIHGVENIDTKDLDVDGSVLADGIVAGATARGASHATRSQLGIVDKSGKLPGQKTTSEGFTISDNNDLISSEVKYNEIQKAIKEAEAAADGSKQSTEKLAALKESAQEAAVDVQKATLGNLQASQALALAAIAPENAAEVNRKNIQDLQGQLDGKDQNGNPLLTGADRKAAIAQQRGYKQQQGLLDIADKFAGQGRAKLVNNFRDNVGQDQTQLDQLNAEVADYKKRKVTGKALDDKLNERDAARRQLANDKADIVLARELGRLDMDSTIDSATAAVLQANAAIKSATTTQALINAQKQKKDALLKQQDADLASAAVAISITNDLTNPVTTANQAVGIAQADYDNAVRNKRAKDVIDTKKLALLNAQNAAEQAAFTEFMNSAQTMQSLGQISSGQYVRMLKARKSQIDAEIKALGPNGQGVYQLLQDSNQLAQAIKSASDAFTSTFNIGDIKIPTAYEVRRAIKSGDVGNIAKSNSAFSQNGNVTNDSSSRNVIMNGVPIQQVISILKDLFGVKVSSSYASKVV